MQVKKNDIGRIASVKYDDAGCVDGLIVGKSEISSERNYIEVFLFHSRELVTVDDEQIVELKGFIKVDTL